MVKLIFIPIIAILLFSCNSSPKQHDEKSSLNVGKTDSVKTSSNTGPSSKSDINSNKDIFPFDSILRNCMDSRNVNGYTEGLSTTGMIDCYTNSAIKLDSIVNEVYHKLYSKLDKGDKRKLKLSQDRWKKFYTAEEDFLYSAFYTWANASKYGHGRDHAISQAEWSYGVVRQRLIDLTKYDDQIYEGYTDQ